MINLYFIKFFTLRVEKLQIALNDAEERRNRFEENVRRLAQAQVEQQHNQGHEETPDEIVANAAEAR